LKKIVERETSAFSNHVRVLFDEQPSDVREEKAARGIVWVGVGVGPFVMSAVISAPLID
jgi:hypothetical protein